jgi:hexosaminidase
MQLFPSKLIHIGGDEVDKADWKHCTKCQARIQQEHLKNEEELQSWFIRNIEQYVISKGRSIIGWDEILEGGLAPNASVMSWRGEQGGIDAAKMQHTVVMTPGTHCYFDHYQADPQSEPIAIGGFTTLKKVYSYEPIPAALPSAFHKYVLGAQANLWTEYIPTVEQAEYMVLPRMQALSEVLWTQKQVTDWSSFIARLQPYLRKFEQQGWRYCEGNFKVAMQPRVIKNTMKMSLESESKDDQIVYTLDGTEPSLFSPIYKDSLVLSNSCLIKAQLVHKQILKGKPSAMNFTMHTAFGVVPTFEKSFSTYYPAYGAATLTDGIFGNTDHHANWLGWSKSDMAATLSFSKDTLVHEVELGCLQNYASWIFFPEWIKVIAINKDGGQKELAMHKMERKATKGAVVNRVKLSFPEQKIKTIKIVAGPLPACPKDHPGYGDTGWLFFDELVVK